MCWRPRQPLTTSLPALEIGGPSCEIASDLRPNPFSHDWHVQPNCQRPNRNPPERSRVQSRRIRPADQGQPYPHPTVLETFQTYRASKNAVNAHIPQNFHEISTSGKVRSGRRTNGAGAFQRAVSMGLPPAQCASSAHGRLAVPRRKTEKLRKDLAFGGPCLEGTLQKPTGVSESSPVAGAIEDSILFYIRCRTRARDAQNYARLATLSRFIVYSR
jgi:hypothetical protein